MLTIPPWNLRLRVMIYRKHAQHETSKNFQLGLFTPDDGHFEYYVAALATASLVVRVTDLETGKDCTDSARQPEVASRVLGDDRGSGAKVFSGRKEYLWAGTGTLNVSEVRNL